MLISLRLTVGACISLRACPKALNVFFSSVPSLKNVKIPSRTSVQRWLAKVGYFKLHMSLEKSNDWIIIVDESIEIGSQKYLAILGCRAKDLPQGRSLSLEDLVPLYAVVRNKSDADFIKEAMDAITLRIGGVLGICSDEGPNLLRGFELYQEEHPNVVHIPDIVHKVANMIKKILNKDPSWEIFIKNVNDSKRKMYNSSSSHLAPPALRGKSRFLNLDVLMEWALEKLDLLKNGNASSEYDPELAERYLGWLRLLEEPVKYFNNLLEVVSIARHLVREKGIHQGIADEFAMEFENSCSSEGWDLKSSELADQIYSFLEAQGKKVSQNQVFLGSSEVIETFFGKFKSMQSNSKAGFSGLVLAGLAHVGKLDKSIVQASIETVTHAQVDEWVKIHIGKTVHAKRCEITGKSEKKVSSILKKISTKMGRILTGYIEGEAMGF